MQKHGFELLYTRAILVRGALANQAHEGMPPGGVQLRRLPVHPLLEGGAAEGGGESDPLYDEAVAIVLRTRRASISAVQRHLRIGYNRAARLIEEMERAGLVSPMQSNGNREVLAPSGE